MATVPTFITFVAGSVLTAAQLNANIRDAGNFMISNRPVCELQQAVVQSLTNSAFTALTWDTEIVDNDNMHSTVTNTSRIVAQTAGRYQISGAASFATNTTGRRVVSIFQNGTELSSAQTEYGIAVSGGPTQIPSRLRQVFLNVNDYLELSAFQSSGGALNTAVTPSSAVFSHVSVRWIGTV